MDENLIAMLKMLGPSGAVLGLVFKQFFLLDKKVSQLEQLKELQEKDAQHCKEIDRRVIILEERTQNQAALIEKDLQQIRDILDEIKEVIKQK